MKNIEKILMEKLLALLESSNVAYRNYLANGKTYLFAKELKKYNGQALQLMSDENAGFPAELNPDLRALIFHYTEWTKKWEALDSSKQHHDDDEFVFANDITFPRQAARNLEVAYKKNY